MMRTAGLRTMVSDDSNMMAIGLGAGLGGFVGLVIIGCILWHVFCGTWCEKKKQKVQPIRVQSRQAVPKRERKSTLTPIQNDKEIRLDRPTLSIDQSN